MNRDAEMVLAGWLKLREADKRAVEEEIAKFRRLQGNQRLEEEFLKGKRVAAGPLGGACVCCGR